MKSPKPPRPTRFEIERRHPLPWRGEILTKQGRIIRTHDTNRETICFVPDEHTAIYIIHTINSYDRLLDAALGLARVIREQGIGDCWFDDGYTTDRWRSEDLTRWLHTIDRASGKVKGPDNLDGG